MSFLNSQSNNRTILDLLTFDLSTFFYGDYQEINSEEQGEMFLIDYEKELPWVEFEIFDYLQFRIFNDKKNIHGSNHINAILINKEFAFTIENTQEFLNEIFQLYGKDDNNQTECNEKDIQDFHEKKLEHIWTIGKTDDLYTIKISFNAQKQFCLSIILFTNLLKKTNNI